jgi:hypothetical protein
VGGGEVRRAAKRDVNHKSIGDHLRALGWSVLDLADHGDGIPDYVVGKPGFCCLLEVKRPGPASARKLTPAEQAVRDRWEGPFIVVQSGEEAAEKLLQLYRGWQ